MKRYYKRYCNVFIKSFMVNGTKHIDKHKISSCMMKAILMTKPLKLPLKRIIYTTFHIAAKNLPVQEYLANELLSLTVAINIMEGYIHDDREKLLKHKIVSPAPFIHINDDYFDYVCLDLHYTGARKFNIITFANVFFLLEKYSCRRVQCENLIIAYKQLFQEHNSDVKPEELDYLIDFIRYKSNLSIENIIEDTKKK